MRFAFLTFLTGNVVFVQKELDGSGMANTEKCGGTNGVPRRGWWVN